MSEQPAVELPAELEPKLRFDSDGIPLVYDLGQQLIRDRKRAGEYLEGHFSGARLIRNLLLFAALIAPIGVPVIAAINGVDPGRVVISTLVGVSLLLLLGCISLFFDNGKNYDMERFGREIARRRRIEFRTWAENSLKIELSEDDLDELQDRIGAARLKHEKKTQSTVEDRESETSQAFRKAAVTDHSPVPYWMGGSLPESPKAPERPQTLDKPVMS